MMCAMYQAHIWCSSHCANIVSKDPLQYGWVEDDDKCMRRVLMTKGPAPLEVRNLTHLLCNDAKCDNDARCPCCSAGLLCLEICRCSVQCERNLKAVSDNKDQSHSDSEEEESFIDTIK